MKQYNVIFDGYWREVNKKYIPEFSGVYIIYRCSYVSPQNVVDLIDVLYIGQADNLRRRLSQHNETEFHTALKTGETLCYACAPVDKEEMNQVENGLVFAEKPPYNDKLKNEYSYDDAEFHLEGTCSLLKKTDFIITTDNDG